MGAATKPGPGVFRPTLTDDERCRKTPRAGGKDELAMRAKEVAALLALAALWGGSFLFIRIAVPVFGPVVLACLRVALAGGGLLVYTVALRRAVVLHDRWRAFLVLGALN